MGCDIHLHVEIKINDKWEHYNAPSMDRNYRLFTLLAGVRNAHDGAVTPIARPRGLPEDMSLVTQIASRWHINDRHSHSWLDAAEIKLVEDWWNEHRRDYAEGRFGIEQQWGYLFGDPLSGLRDCPEDYPPQIQDVRIVFWFDN